MPTTFFPFCDYNVIQDSSPGTHLWSTVAGAFVPYGDATYLSWLSSAASDGLSIALLFRILDCTSADAGASTSLHLLDASLFTTGQTFNISGTGAYDGNRAITTVDATHVKIPVAFAGNATGTIATPQILPTMAGLLQSIDDYNQSVTPPTYLAASASGNYQMANTPPRLFDFTPLAAGLVVKLPQMNLPKSLAKGRELLIYNSGGLPFQVEDVNGLGLMTPFGVLPGNAFMSIHLKSNTTTGGTFATAILTFPIEQTAGDSNISMGNFSLEGLPTVFRLSAALTAPRTWTLPAANKCVQGSLILVVDAAGGVTSTNTLSVARSGADTINGGAGSVILNRAYDWVLLETDGNSLWTIVGGKGALNFSDLLGSVAASQMPALTGDVTMSAGTTTTTLANIPNDTTMAGDILATNIAAPSSPAAGKDRIYVDSTDKRLHDKNDAGTVGTTVVADTGAANNFLTAISAAGVVSKAQPATTNLSDVVATGSWTPTDTSGAGLTFSNVSTQYTQIGNLIFAYGQLTFPATGSGANALISLPVNSANAGYGATSNNLTCTVLQSVAAITGGNVGLGRGNFAIYNTATQALVTNAALSGAQLRFIIAYPVA